MASAPRVCSQRARRCAVIGSWLFVALWRSLRGGDICIRSHCAKCRASRSQAHSVPSPLRALRVYTIDLMQSARHLVCAGRSGVLLGLRRLSPTPATLAAHLALWLLFSSQALRAWLFAPRPPLPSFATLTSGRWCPSARPTGGSLHSAPTLRQRVGVSPPRPTVAAGSPADFLSGLGKAKPHAVSESCPWRYPQG